MDLSNFNFPSLQVQNDFYLENESFLSPITGFEISKLHWSFSISANSNNYYFKKNYRFEQTQFSIFVKFNISPTKQIDILGKK